jgi:hypothetical protein
MHCMCLFQRWKSGKRSASEVMIFSPRQSWKPSLCSTVTRLSFFIAAPKILISVLCNSQKTHEMIHNLPSLLKKVYPPMKQCNISFLSWLHGLHKAASLIMVKRTNIARNVIQFKEEFKIWKGQIEKRQNPKKYFIFILGEQNVPK